MIHKTITSIVILFAIVPTFCFAGAWTLPKDAQQHIVTYRTYSTASYFSGDGKERDKRGRFTKNEINYYGEFGLRDNWTTGLSLFVSRASDVQRFDAFTPFGESTEATRTLELAGLTRSELFVRHQLFRDSTYAFALQPTVTLPSIYTTNVPDGVTKDPFEVELSALGGRNFSAFGRTHYADAKAGYRYRTGILGNQYVLQGTLGLSVNDNWTIQPEVEYIGAVGGINFATTTITGQNDYNLTKLQLSALYRVNDDIRLQAGAFSHASGRNTGAGGGGLLSLWIQL